MEPGALVGLAVFAAGATLGWWLRGFRPTLATLGPERADPAPGAATPATPEPVDSARPVVRSPEWGALPAAPDVRAALDAWTEACLAASRVAWVLEVPAGDLLLEAWSRRGPAPDDPTGAFARWFVGEVGLASRRGLVDREVAERRDVVAVVVLRACARLVEAVAPELSVEVEPPSGVGPAQRDRWLADPVVAARLGNPPVGGVVRPVITLRPLLRRGDRVLLEGEVA